MSNPCAGWEEITAAKQLHRHELILSGPELSKRIEQNGIDHALFTLTDLNFLSISETSMDSIPNDIYKLSNLSNLVLHSNKIKALPQSIGDLSKLKNVDVSKNCLEVFPEEVKNLSQLYSLNASFNKLTSFPCLKLNTRLTILNLSNNAFEEFPDICDSNLIHLSELKLSKNSISVIPHSISVLQALKHFDISENKLKEVPGELADISKLKELNLKDNPLSEKRLQKLVIQCHPKQVLDYVRQHGKRDALTGPGKNNKKGSKIVDHHPPSSQVASNDIPVEDICQSMKVLHVSDSTPEVHITKEVKSVRPFIVCCIVKNISFTVDTFSKFIKLQTKIHDDIKLCNKRQAATIATHDLAAIPPGPLKFIASPPEKILMQPLGSTKDTLASVVFSRLQNEAHAMMMDRKRNKYSGIHKFLYLLQGKPLYPFLVDNSMRVISFPPITNSNVTKMSVNSKAMLVEVTSSASQAVCRTVLDTLLLEFLKLGIGTEDTDGKSHSLTIEQVKVMDPEGNLQNVYPSRNDLAYEEGEVQVVRNY